MYSKLPDVATTIVIDFFLSSNAGAPTRMSNIDFFAMVFKPNVISCDLDLFSFTEATD